ncbi:hypothetical protein IAT38_000127 [Cryptococcus sp. DSM 104549]
MPLHPHIHLFLPSSDASISLEARLYLPIPPEGSAALPLTTEHASYTQSPLQLNELGSAALPALEALGVERLVVAAHPWGRLGGNMLDPVIQQLVSAVFTPAEAHDPALSSPTAATPPPRTAILTYNVRGVGLSQGSQPWTGVGADPADLAELERTAAKMVGGVKDVWRFGYSWGSLLVTLAPPPPQLRRILLVSPPLKILGGVTYFSSSSFTTSLKSLLTSGRTVKLIYGTKDEFTSAKAFRAYGKDWAPEAIGGAGGAVAEDHSGAGSGGKDGRDLVKLEKIEIEDADHLYRRDEGEKLREEIGKWLGWTVGPRFDPRASL